MTRLDVYVPVDGKLCDEIWDGAGIVGSPVGATERLRLDYEGDREVYERYEDRGRRAAERHLWVGPGGQQGYPTSAMAYADPEAVVKVGWWDPDEAKLEVTESDVLANWVGGSGECPEDADPSAEFSD
jgi:hypothetical protein